MKNKTFTWILSVIGAFVVGMFLWRWFKRATAVKDPSARDKDDLAASVQSANRDIQAAQTVTAPGVLTPKASWVRVNGAITDMNRLGGNVPSLVTAPVLSPWQ